MAARRAGKIAVSKNGVRLDAKGSFSYNLGADMRETITGSDRVHGYKEMPQAPFIEGEVTDDADLDVRSLLETVDATITLELANGKVVTLRDAWFEGEGTVQTEEANIAVRFVGLSADED